MAKYVFPAVFEPDKELGGYCVYFPDFENCATDGIVTQGDDLKHAMDMAEDVLCFTLHSMEQRNVEIPKASNPKDIKTDEGNIINLVACDTEFYVKYFANKSVKLNVTIPHWLKEAGEKKHVNFSQILQNGLKEYLQIQ